MALAACAVPAAFAQAGAALVPQAGWTLHFADSQDLVGGYYPAVNAFDGDPATMWVTEWWSASPPPPHDMQIHLGAIYDVSGFRYLPRQDGVPHGTIAEYQFYVSMDGVTWGSPVATGSFSSTASEQQVLFTAKQGRYIRLRALTEVNGQPWTAVAELNVLANDAPAASGASGGGGGGSTGALSRAGWAVHFTDSQELVGGYYAANVFDGDPTTLWVTDWVAGAPPPPHEVQIDLGGTQGVNGFRYLPRQDGLPHGRIAQYQFYVSTDGFNWGTAVASGTFPNTADEQEVLFTPKTGRYIRLRAMTEVNGQPWSAVAELNVLGTSSGAPSNQAPIVSLTDTGGSGPYASPARIALRATASDPDGTVTGVDFYAGSTWIRSDTTAPYDAVLENLGPGSYAFVAVAHDNSGNTTVSSTVTRTVTDPQMPGRAVFTPSWDHNSIVERYVLDIFPAGADPSVSNPVATLDLGKPAVVNGECSADISAAIASLWPGAYVATVTAVGSGGSAQSAPSPEFYR